MTLNVLLPNGANANLDDLNEHDLAQFYMYQMDMLQQAEALFDSLGLDNWRNSNWRNGQDVALNAPVLDIARESKHASEFLAPPAPGNVLPTLYDANRWQGAIVNANGRSECVYVDAMTREQLVVDIEKQARNVNTIVANSSAFSRALSNFSSNVAAATQAPDLDLTL